MLFENKMFVKITKQYFEIEQRSYVCPVIKITSVDQKYAYLNRFIPDFYH